LRISLKNTRLARIAKRVRNAWKFGVGEKALERKRGEKRRVREKGFASEAWRRDDAFAHRRYASYEEYLEHQSSKLARVIDRKRRDDVELFPAFHERFSRCSALADARSVLCLGARLGTEVRALLSLGHFAVGIDLEPGPDNRFVLHGDFHNLVFADGSVDAVYSNALDHVFDLDRVVREVRRVLRPGGCFIAEVDEGYDEGCIPGEFESIQWKNAAVLVERIVKAGGLEFEEARSLGRDLRGPRRLLVFRNPP
jgi:SAM-dependent methyltransferase